MLGIKVYTQGRYLGWLTNLSMLNYTYKTNLDVKFAKTTRSILTARSLCDKLSWITYGNVAGVVDTIPKEKEKAKGKE